VAPNQIQGEDVRHLVLYTAEAAYDPWVVGHPPAFLRQLLPRSNAMVTVQDDAPLINLNRDHHSMVGDVGLQGGELARAEVRQKLERFSSTNGLLAYGRPRSTFCGH
jgi:hypothetical protein